MQESSTFYEEQETASLEYDASVEQTELAEATECQGGGGNVATKWIKFAEFHVALGYDGLVIMDRDSERETLSQVAIKSGGEWDAGFTMLERNTAAWHKERAVTGAHNRLWYARYEYGRWEKCPEWWQTGFCRPYWGPKRWLGSIKPGKAGVGQGAAGAWGGGDGTGPYIEAQDPGEVTIAKQARNRSFSIGVVVKGVGLKTQAGYSNGTALRWEVKRRCIHNWMDGVNQYLIDADVIYTWSARCST